MFLRRKVHTHKAHTHLLEAYPSEEAIVDRVASFLRDGLEDEGVAIVIATQEHRLAIRPRLPPEHADRVYWRDAQETLDLFMEGDDPDPARFEATVGGLLRGAQKAGLVHAYGEMVALLCAQGRPKAALSVERLWNRLLDQEGGVLLCGYPEAAFQAVEHADVLHLIRAEHAPGRHIGLPALAPPAA